MDLKVGQILISQRVSGTLDSYPALIIAKIIRVNKNTYRIKTLDGREESIMKDTLKVRSEGCWYAFSGQTFLPVDQTQLTKEVIKNYCSAECLEKKKKDLDNAVELIRQAKYYLEQLPDVESINPEPEEEDPYDEDWDDFWDYEAEERGDNDIYDELNESED